MCSISLSFKQVLDYSDTHRILTYLRPPGYHLTTQKGSAASDGLGSSTDQRDGATECWMVLTLYCLDLRLYCIPCIMEPKEDKISLLFSLPLFQGRKSP